MNLDWFAFKEIESVEFEKEQNISTKVSLSKEILTGDSTDVRSSFAYKLIIKTVNLDTFTGITNENTARQFSNYFLNSDNQKKFINRLNNEKLLTLQEANEKISNLKNGIDSMIY